jgi:hypothetical protein
MGVAAVPQTVAKEAGVVRMPSAVVAASAWRNTGEEKHKSASSSTRAKSQRRMLRSGSLRCARRSAARSLRVIIAAARVAPNGVSAAVTVTAIGVATAPPTADQEARVVRMPSAVVAAASVVKAGKTAVVGTAAEVNKPHLK